MRAPVKAVTLLVLFSASFFLPRLADAERPGAAASASAAVRSQVPVAGNQPAALTPSELENLLPATVYYRGKHAPIQLRNAAGVRFGANGYCLATIVDTSGYASAVQETYQMYLITETGLTIAGQHVNPGAYGAGVVNGKFLLMDIGGHTILQADTVPDPGMRRPRPLQMLVGPAGDVTLYLGRTGIGLAPVATP